MAGVQLGLEIAFYLYPCGLFATLLSSQGVEYYCARKHATSSSSTSAAASSDEKDTAKTSRFYARLIWVLQLLLSLLLASPLSLSLSSLT